MDQDIIAKVQGFGFDVYMRKPEDTWLYFTDGTNVGYLQADRVEGITLSTVHVPNNTSGTGFRAEGTGGVLTREALLCAFATAPGWASSRDRESVKKYRDFESFRKSSQFNDAYRLVPKV